MKFDKFDETGAGSALMPDGTHECEITKVKEVVRKSDGCEVIVVTLTATDGDFDPLEKWLDPANKYDHRAAMQLLSALGLQADADIDDTLVGRRVLVTTKQGIKKTTGLATVYVNAFAASGADQPPPAPTSKPPAARSQAAKAHREFTANSSAPDDIPF